VSHGGRENGGDGCRIKVHRKSGEIKAPHTQEPSESSGAEKRTRERKVISAQFDSTTSAETVKCEKKEFRGSRLFRRQISSAGVMKLPLKPAGGRQRFEGEHQAEPKLKSKRIGAK